MTNDDLQQSGYNLMRSDHDNNSKRGSVCLYYKKSLGNKVSNVTYLSVWMFCEFSVRYCEGFVSVVYRSPESEKY